VQVGGHTRSAGTSEIARQSGGDSSNIDDSNALQDTLERIRNRYALYFYVPEGTKAGSERNIEVSLTAAARQRYQGSEVRYRQRYLAPGAGGAPDTIDAEPVTVSQTPESAPSTNSRSGGGTDSNGGGLRRRRPAVDDTGGSRGPNSGGGWPAASGSDSNGGVLSPSAPASSSQQQTEQGGGWKRSDDPAPSTMPAPSTTDSKSPAPAPAEPEQKGGWHRVKPGEQP
jgi:hypothetical protein